MKSNKIIEAWRSEESYRELSEEERAALPDNPAGVVEVDDEALLSVTGGCGGPTSAYCTPCRPLYCY